MFIAAVRKDNFPRKRATNHSKIDAPMVESGDRFFTVTEFEPLLDSDQAAGLLRIHPKTLQKMARRGEIHGSHVGKLWRLRASDLDDWLHRQRRAS
jgi:excisionase family DNA binding protein